MKTILGHAEWRLVSEDYEGCSDDSSVTVYKEDHKIWLELACNDVRRRLQIQPHALERLDQNYPICADTDRDVASVAERLGLRLVA
jgi:hypothetical protein